MRNIFTILLLTGITIGAVFLFRISLKQTLVDVDIEELAKYSQTIKEKETAALDTFPTTQNTPAHIEPEKNTVAKAEMLPTLETDILPETPREVSAPPPLKKIISLVTNGSLSIPGVVAATNAERHTNGAGPLVINAELAAAAAAKLQDMFAKQYFEHVGPDGSQPSDWVDTAGYAYKLTGENLALGDFSGDTDLVTAWMNSPGHRANMLKPEFTEIGVAVGKDIFEGQNVWLAVQVFGRPMPNCASLDAVLKKTITDNQALLETMNLELTAEQETLRSNTTTSDIPQKERIDTYNTLVVEYNTFIAKTEALVEQYNLSVQAFNACMAQ